MRPDPDAELQRALRASSLPTAEACPSDTLLAGYAERRLPAEKLELVQAHLAGCDRCRDLVVELGGVLEQPTLRALPPQGRTAGPGWPRWAAAAGIVVGLGVLTYNLAFRGPGEELGEEEQLLAQERELRAARPDLFLAVAGPDLAPPSAGAARSGLDVLAPAGRLRSDRPSFAWTAVPGAKDYFVTARGAEDGVLWVHVVTGLSLAWPTDVPAAPRGRTLSVEIVARGALGQTTARRAFRVADAAELAVLDDGLAEIERREYSPLLAADFEKQRGFLEAAAQRLEALEGSELVRARRRSVREVLGWPAQGPLPVTGETGR